MQDQQIAAPEYARFAKRSFVRLQPSTEDSPPTPHTSSQSMAGLNRATHLARSPLSETVMGIEIVGWKGGELGTVAPYF